MSSIRQGAALTAGIGLTASAAALGSRTLVTALRGAEAAAVPEYLLTGAVWFRFAAAALGVWIALLAIISLRWPQSSARPRLPRAPRRLDVALALAALLAVAAALRFHRLGDELWYDEIFMRVHYVSLSWGRLVTTFDSQNQHFLYTLLAKLAVSAFGDGAWSLRLPSAIFGVASLWALYLVAAALVSRREALLAVALLTVSYHHVWFSQNARGYMGLLLWTLASGWLFVRALENEDRRRWVAYAVVVVAGMYTQLSMLFVVAGHFLTYARVELLARRRASAARATGLAFGFIPAGLGTLVLYALVLPEFLAATLHKGAGIPVWQNPMWALAEAVHSLRIGPLGAVVLAVGTLAFCAGCLRLARRNWIALELFFYPVGLCLAVILVQGHHVWPRLLFFACGYAAMIIVAGVYEILEHGARLLGYVFERRLDRIGEVAATITCLAMVAASAAALPRAYGPKQDFLGAITYIEASAGPGDSMLVAGMADVPVVEYYGRHWPKATDASELERIVQQSKATWLVYTLPFQLQSSYPDVMHVIESRFRIVRRFPATLGSGQVIVCRATAQPEEIDTKENAGT